MREDDTRQNLGFEQTYLDVWREIAWLCGAHRESARRSSDNVRQSLMQDPVQYGDRIEMPMGTLSPAHPSLKTR